MQQKRTLSILLSVALGVQSLFPHSASSAPAPSEVHALAVDINLRPVGLFPANGAQSVVTNTNLKLTFGEVVVTGSGIVSITNIGDPANSKAIDIADSASVQLDDQGKSIVIKPGVLAPGHYQVSVPSSAIRSYASTNEFAGVGSSEWTFQVQELSPVVTNYVPANGLQTVDPATQTSLSVNFSRAVTSGAGYIQIKRAADNVTVHTIAASELAVAGTVVSGPLRGLDYNTNYYVLIDPGVIKDANNGGDFAGIGAAGWTFTTKPALDTTKPKATAFNPANNGTLSNLSTNTLSLSFDEKVFANASKGMVIRNAATNAIFCTVTAESTVGAAGSNVVTVNLATSACPQFANNTDYSVTIGPDVYRDASGNYFDGVVWKFKALADTTPPAISSYYPAVSATAISTSLTELSLTFNEPLGSLVSSATAQIFPQNAPNSKREMTMTIDPSNNQRVLLKIPGSTKLSASTLYSVTVPANIIRDTTGNLFAGVTNPYQWTFQTGTNSVPTISNSTINGTSIVLTYSENLDSAKVPNASNFYATVNDVSRAITGVSISNNEVRLTLQGSALIGQTVKLSYYPDAVVTKRLQNASGIEAASFNGRVLTNATDSTLPKPESGNYYGNSLSLTFNRPLAEVAIAFQSQIQSQFTVKQNGNTIGINSAFLSGSFLNLTLNSNSSSAQPVSVSYTPGAYPLRDPSGNMVPAFTNFYVRNNYDNEPPQLTSAALNSNKIVMTYNEGLNTTNIPPTTSFSIVTTGSTPPNVSKVAVVNNTIELTLSQGVSSNVPVLLYYYPSSPAIMDLSGNLAPPIVGYNFTSGSSDVAQLASSSIANSQLTLVYSAPLNPNTAPYSSQYTVKYDGITIPVMGVSVSGTQVAINLSTAVKTGQTVTLSYITSGNPLRDTLDRQVAALNNITVGAQTGTVITNLPDYLESDGAGAVRLVAGKGVTTSSSVTPSGRAAKRYSVDPDKLAASYSLIKTNNSISVPRVSVRIPASEAGAIVSLPVQTLITSVSHVSNAEFMVDYGDVQFTLPLRAINYAKQLQKIGANSSSDATLLLGIEKVSNTSFITALASQGVQRLATPADFTASIQYGGKDYPIDGYEMFVKRTFVVPAAVGTTGYISVVRVDESTGKVTYAPTTTETSGTSIKVNFLRKSNSTYAVVRKTMQYVDMRGHWANNDVSLLASKFIVDGPTSTTFEPKKNITRADFAQYIVRGLGLNGDKSAASRFSDISVSGAAAAYIGAASAAGIVQGGSDGKFRPNAAITREEMATMMVRAMNVAGVQLSADSNSLNLFQDRSKVSGWARDGVSISVQAGIIEGASNNRINPQSNATRAEAAVMIKRLLQYVDFLDS